ncbi:uncharacterized protein ACLA_090390 [Aspergillus clavatus NRRL 1]|uniref:DUF7587 domain-containing protein n=1 Tax=Aspergillus clavatus (strain ATCC 1007 / CBS 513.65 / DSM 816 / NCTC 3887 / NRRL 1 / QM 1276 / 107) TaxID=344612 RepID=A1CEP7_ASPCL|nr:uncharacterized protein ACLA_090390 [Aspergillus clavatus NRRL 1]EAW11346.1 conserved hypothetical protein [Aspergillus clavatus NRRL 1]
MLDPIRRESLLVVSGPRQQCKKVNKLFAPINTADNGNKDYDNSTNTQLPRLLYRWSNADSQGINTPKHFIAGLFSDTEAPRFRPENIPSEQFDKYVLNHVSIAQETSPFISTFQSVLAPIHRALRGMEGARVTIIDSQRLTTPVYSARDLVHNNAIHIRGYSGIGEFLIWHEVRSPAIVCSFKITTLVQFAQENEEINTLLQLNRIASYRRVRGRLRTVLSREEGSMNLNHHSGQGIGRLLRFINIPQEYYQTVGEGIMRSWQLRKRGSWPEFFEGMQLGFFSMSAQWLRPMKMAATYARENELAQDIEDERDLSINEDDEEEDDDSDIDTPSPAPMSPIDTQELEELGDLIVANESPEFSETDIPESKDKFASERERIKRLLQ